MITWKQLFSESWTDTQYSNFIKKISQGFPDNRQELDPNLPEYWEVRDCLTHHSKIVYMDNSIVITRELRNQVLENLPSANQRIQGMKLICNSILA